MGWRDFNISIPSNKIDKRDKTASQNSFVDKVCCVEKGKDENEELRTKSYRKNKFKVFSPDGTLETLFSEAHAGEWTDNRLLTRVGELIQDKTLKAPWGFRLHDSPLVADGVYWIISDSAARQRLPIKVLSFTFAELQSISQVLKVFKGAMVVEVIKSR